MGNVQDVPKYCYGCDGEMEQDEDVERLNHSFSLRHLSFVSVDEDARLVKAWSSPGSVCSAGHTAEVSKEALNYDIDLEFQEADKAAEVAAGLTSHVLEEAPTQPARIVDLASSSGRLCSTRSTRTSDITSVCDSEFHEADKAAEAAAGFLSHTPDRPKPATTIAASSERRTTRHLHPRLFRRAGRRDFKASTLGELDNPGEHIAPGQDANDAWSETTMTSLFLDLEGKDLKAEEPLTPGSLFLDLEGKDLKAE
eukprot:CAMPEP_0118921154 /NCGR_PEP_ID=MMETSP1169-20130426/525_1 /TAXON_ID=36882 /ORGANISM="Pyramimonas obovata, Strain CCMP722" /LENGTH=253 /DNA_ID=CAMNT_0006861829 /DNA_START=100 /DNA_END=858 /DNA_ORIENTATION=-